MALDVPHRWKRAYVRCLFVKYSGGKASVMLDTTKAKGADAMFAAAIEQGVPSKGIDMKPWYKGQTVNIPIMHTEEKRGTYKVKSPWTRGAMEEQLKLGGRAPAGMVERLSYTHLGQNRLTVSDPLARALRQTEPFRGSGRSRGQAGSIVTFRRLSPQSPSHSWWWCRGGKKAHNLAKKVGKRVGQIAAEALR